MDGDTTDISEATEPTEALEETSEELQPEQAVQEPEDHITAEQLVSYLRKAHFDTTRGRRGYHQGEVNAFLLRLMEAVDERQPLADLVRRSQFTQVRLEDGYDHEQVDHFLAAVVDLDPNAATKPEPARGGLVSKLFG